MTAQKFTNDNGMWDGFAGCEQWNETDQPVFREVGNWLIVADRASTGCYHDDDEEMEGLEMPFGFPTQAAAIAFLNGLPETFTPADYGFAPWGAYTAGGKR